MTIATWRVLRLDHNGEDMAAFDYDDKSNAIDHLNAARRIGLHAGLYQYDPFTGTWIEWEDS